MRKFDAIVIGGGSGLNISAELSEKYKVAIIEEGPLGGTCLNRGCIPSKMLIHHADLAEMINDAKRFDIDAKIKKIDFAKITKYVSNFVDKDSGEIEHGIKHDKNSTLYRARAKFIGKKILKIGNEEITADKIFIVAGTREFIPPIQGLNKVDYITSTEALRLKKLPKTLTIIGGGYIAAELGHFYHSLGSKVTIIQRNKLLIPREDFEIASKFTEIAKKKYDVLLEYNANKVEKKGKFIVYASKEGGKGSKVIKSDQLLVATGRISNADILEVSKSGIEVDEKGFIKSDEYLESNVPGIFVAGDIAGRYMFKHSANYEASFALYNAYHDKKIKVNYNAMPHAIFSSPQIAGVGYTEQELKEKKIKYRVGRYEYINTGMGAALKEEDGFVKILVDDNGKILGCHIIGKEASTLIHEVLIAMRNNLDIDAIRNTIFVHPALSEVVQRAANSVEF